MNISFYIIEVISGIILGVSLTFAILGIASKKEDVIIRDWTIFTVSRKENPLEKKLDDFADEAGIERLSSEEKIEAARRYLLSTK